MKRTLALFLFFSLVFNVINAQSPKREMRAVWLATMARLDWPPQSAILDYTGNTTRINTQKNAMITILDEMQAANMNAVYFQVRSRCDAVYKSAYEPWSADFVGVRGRDPGNGYDPLAFVVEEAHKRGIEVHAWVNPYRFESTTNQWKGQAGDYRTSNPSWLLTYSTASPYYGYSMLDPGRPDVQTRIKNIVIDIVKNYDIDGVVFDDYFYHYSGTSNTLDQTTQNTYNTTGLSVANWRRKNVNDLITGVYDAIQATKSYVTFGVSPFGIWTISTTVARNEGLTLPSGVTGMDAYNQIYCDAVAWLKAGKVDYISPQLYWQIGGAQDYNALCTFWSDVAYKYNRYFYSSQSAHNHGTGEIGSQIAKNRSATKNAAPGSVLYSKKDLPASYLNTLKSNYFTQKALPPAITWKSRPSYGAVGTPTRSGNTLSWSAVSGVPGGARYTVYAVPSSLTNPTSRCSTSQYLLGISYTSSYTLSSSYTSGYNYVVGLLDRLGNEFLPGDVQQGTLTLAFSSIPSNDPYIPVPATVEKGKSVYLTIHDGNGYITRSSCTLSSSNPNIATIDANGMVTGVSAGTTIIKAVRHTGGSGEGTITFTVTGDDPIGEEKLTLNISSSSTSNMSISPTVPVGNQNVYLYININGSAVNRQDCDLTSSDTNVASISEWGTITVGSAGTTTLKAVRKSDKAYGTLVLTVGDGSQPTTSLTLNFSSTSSGDTPTGGATIDVNESVWLFIRSNGTSVSRQDCDLTSSNTGVASIDVYGKITGMGAGTTTIKAVRKSDKAQGTIELMINTTPTGTLKLKIVAYGASSSASAISSVSVGNLAASLWISDADGKSVTRGAPTILTSSSPATATVNEFGTINTFASGMVTFKAINGSEEGTISLTVLPAVDIKTQEKNTIKIYSNETDVTAQFEGEAAIELYAISGVLIENVKAIQTYFRKLERGVYIIVIHYEGQVFRNKLIIN